MAAQMVNINRPHHSPAPGRRTVRSGKRPSNPPDLQRPRRLPCESQRTTQATTIARPLHERQLV